MGWTIRSFSIEETDLEHLTKLKELGGKDRKTQSKMVVVAIKEYVNRHAIPNPQADLVRCLDVQLPHKPSWQCCCGTCERHADFELILKDFDGKVQKFRVCKLHKEWRHEKYKFLIGTKPFSK